MRIQQVFRDCDPHLRYEDTKGRGALTTGPGMNGISQRIMHWKTSSAQATTSAIYLRREALA
jgi:hypothetical protein